MSNDFAQLENIVLEILKSGRPNWDVPHTLTSVYYMKELLKYEIGEERILISTMYLHDIGYSTSSNNLSTHDGTISAKNDHMKNGIIIARPILEKLNYEEYEINEILHLIGVHDNIEILSSSNEILVFEADSLAQIDISRVRSNFQGEDKKKFIAGFEEKRLNNFKTQTGKELISKLFKEAKEFYLNN